jgi:hypothetical protein
MRRIIWTKDKTRKQLYLIGVPMLFCRLRMIRPLGLTLRQLEVPLIMISMIFRPLELGSRSIIRDKVIFNDPYV